MVDSEFNSNPDENTVGHSNSGGAPDSGASSDLEPQESPRSELLAGSNSPASAPDVLPESVEKLLLEKYGDGSGVLPKLAVSTSIHKTQFTTLESPQFSIVELMIITTIVFATLIAISKVGLVGTCFCFVICFLGMLLARNYITSPTRYRFWNQVVWGMLMPMACIFGDPFVFGSYMNGVPGYFSPHAVTCYAFIGWQMIMLACSWFVSPDHKFLNEFVTGTFFAAALFCYGVGICIAPLAFLGSLFLIGLPGWTPIITANVFLGTAKMHRQRANPVGMIQFTEVTGFVVAVLMAAIGFGVSTIFQQQINDALGISNDFFF